MQLVTQCRLFCGCCFFFKMVFSVHETNCLYWPGAFASCSLFAQKTQVGDFTAHLDIGAPKVQGNTVYSKKDKSYIISGGGYNIWFGRDELQYAFNKLRGDFTLTANFAFIGAGKEAHRKTGWMIRSSLVDSAMQICATVHGDGLTVLQWRGSKGMKMRPGR